MFKPKRRSVFNGSSLFLFESVRSLTIFLDYVKKLPEDSPDLEESESKLYDVKILLSVVFLKTS